MNEVNFQVINNDVLLEIPVISETTKGGIIKSDSQIKAEQAKMDKFLLVVNISDKCEQIKIGDRVYIAGGKHTQIQLEGKTYIIVNELMILGKKKNV